MVLIETASQALFIGLQNISHMLELNSTSQSREILIGIYVIVSILHFSGCFLLWMFSLPSFTQQLRRQETFESDIQEYINTNLSLLSQCICLAVVVTRESEDLNDNIYNLVFGEIFYRGVAVIALFSLKLERGTPDNVSSAPETNRDSSGKLIVPDAQPLQQSHDCASDSMGMSGSQSVSPTCSSGSLFTVGTEQANETTDGSLVM